MNFKLKAYIQRFLSPLPHGENINYIFQKYVTKSLPISDDDFVQKLISVQEHYNNFLNHSTIKADNAHYYEFGAGYDMLIPISMSLLGFKKLTCIDIRELVFPELINDSIARLRKFAYKFPVKLVLSGDIPLANSENFKKILKEHFRIDYLAPLDARNTELKNDSVDFIVSNATMEHIPKGVLEKIFPECQRIMKPNSIMSNVIDYRDHCSFFDNSISIYNYLQFSEDEWKKYNPEIMNQNRLRHKDYIKIIRDSKFEIIVDIPDYPDDKDNMRLRKINLDQYFSNNYTFEELSIRSSMIVLKKATN